MRKMILAFTCILVMACNLGRAASTPVQPGNQEQQIPSPYATRASESTSVAVSVPNGTIPPPIEASPTPIVVVPIPVTSVQIEGMPYNAYQIPGDPFRFVCPEPCPLDQQYIYAEYAGFRAAHAKLIELTGIDTLTELQPVDMHLDLTDSICGDAPYGHAYVYSGSHQAYTCIDGPGYYPTLEEKIRAAATLDGQFFTLHEYMHTFFFGRLSGKASNFEDYKAPYFHDFVNLIPAYAIEGLDPAVFCTYRDLAPGDYGGWLINELCRQNGFQLQDLAPSLVELDKIYQSGGGQGDQEGYAHPGVSVTQYRDVLNRLLGSDTTQAFLDACWPPGFFGNSYKPGPACAVAPVIDGTPTPVQ